MKTCSLFVVATLLSSATVAFAQTPTASSGNVTAGMSGSPSPRAVSRESLEHQLTAKNLIGKDVYTSGGERLGQIADLVLPSSGSLAGAFNGGRSDKGDVGSTANGRSDSALGGPGVTGGSQTRAGDRNATGESDSYSSTNPRSISTGSGSATTASRTASGSSSSVGKSASTTGSSVANGSTGQSGSANSSRSIDGYAAGSTDSTSQYGSHSMSSIQAVISTGGFMRGGRDMVQVDLASLSYDSAQDRVILAGVTDSEWSSVRGSVQNTR